MDSLGMDYNTCRILNDDVLIEIFGYLSFRQVVDLLGVSQQFRDCCRQRLKKVKVLRLRSQLMTDNECYTRDTLSINGFIFSPKLDELAESLLKLEILVVNQELSTESIVMFAQNCPHIESLCFGPQFISSLTSPKLDAIVDSFDGRLNRLRLYSPEVFPLSLHPIRCPQPMREILYEIMFEVFECLDNPFMKCDIMVNVNDFISHEWLSDQDLAKYLNEIVRRFTQLYPGEWFSLMIRCPFGCSVPFRPYFIPYQFGGVYGVWYM